METAKEIPSDKEARLVFGDEINDFKPLLQQYNVNGSVLKINLTEYGYSCGDGCCYNYGTITTVNGVELPCHNQDAGMGANGLDCQPSK